MMAGIKAPRFELMEGAGVPIYLGNNQSVAVRESCWHRIPALQAANFPDDNSQPDHWGALLLKI